MNLTHCPLTELQFETSIAADILNPQIFSYEYGPAGKVRIAITTAIDLRDRKIYRNSILAGICRNNFENNVDPPLITTNFIATEVQNIKYPKNFKERCYHFLKYLYNKGGNDFKSFTFVNVNDYPICYCEDFNEFSKVIKHLEERGSIRCGNIQLMAMGIKRYTEVQMSDLGIEEAEKDLPNIPMIGLVDQKITTGDKETDEKINHAITLFYQEPQNVDRMRSACETLIFVLEPLRQKIKVYFNSDTEDFFHIVNSFDIRHNKNSTKNIQHPEQLEWVFYSLLNTINSYSKLNRRLGSAK